MKPANIKLTPDGDVKVLDFGLAKPSEATFQGDLSESPTLTFAPTGKGVLMGTAAYMSPEQVRGQEVDKRSDIWAFGVVLWEILTGRTLFGGETVSDVLASTLQREPDWEGYPDFSPDGRWVAYTSTESGRDELYVRPFPSPGPAVQISTYGVAPDGRFLFNTRPNPADYGESVDEFFPSRIQMVENWAEELRTKFPEEY